MGKKAVKSGESQSERFEQTARDLGVDLDEAKLAEALRKLAKNEPEKKKDGDK